MIAMRLLVIAAAVIGASVPVRSPAACRLSRAELVRPAAGDRLGEPVPDAVDGYRPRGPAIGLAAGLGLVTFSDASGPIWCASSWGPTAMPWWWEYGRE